MLKSIIYKSLYGVDGMKVWITLIIFMIFIIVVLPSEAARSQQFFGDTSPPDTFFYYSGEELYRIAGDFDSQGRAYYIRSRFTFDIVWPIVYGLFLWAAIAYFLKSYKYSRARYLVLLPIIGVLLDFLENTGASLVMALYPEKFSPLLHIVPIFTLTKWLSIGASFLALVLLMTTRCIMLFQSR